MTKSASFKEDKKSIEEAKFDLGENKEVTVYRVTDEQRVGIIAETHYTSGREVTHVSAAGDQVNIRGLDSTGNSYESQYNPDLAKKIRDAVQSIGKDDKLTLDEAQKAHTQAGIFASELAPDSLFRVQDSFSLDTKSAYAKVGENHIRVHVPTTDGKPNSEMLSLAYVTRTVSNGFTYPTTHHADVTTDNDIVYATTRANADTPVQYSQYNPDMAKQIREAAQKAIQSNGHLDPQEAAEANTIVQTVLKSFKAGNEL